MTEVFQLMIGTAEAHGSDWTHHSTWDTEANATESAAIMGFGCFMVQPRRVFTERDLLPIGEPD